MIEKIIDFTNILYKEIMFNSIKTGTYFVYCNELFIKYSSTDMFNISRKLDINIANSIYIKYDTKVIPCSEINIYYKLER